MRAVQAWERERRRALDAGGAVGPVAGPSQPGEDIISDLSDLSSWEGESDNGGQVGEEGEAGAFAPQDAEVPENNGGAMEEPEVDAGAEAGVVYAVEMDWSDDEVELAAPDEDL